MTSQTKQKRTKKQRGEPLPTQVIGPCKETEGADVAEALHQERLKERQTLIDRFLAWRLPASVCSDLCVTDRDYKFPRSGTNLLTADEARQMLDYLLGAV